MTENTRILLRRQCEGLPEVEDFEVSSGPMPEPADGQLLCETIYVSLDPYLRGKISGRHMSGNILPGELMVSEAISRVVQSNHPDYAAGDIISGFTGWQEYSAIDADTVRRIDPSLAPLSTFLGILGMPGLTAYAGLLRLGEPKAGDTVLVSAASGAVGSLVGQIAKIKGCRTVGIAGAPEKCAWVTDVAGFDDVVSYRNTDLRAELDRACPDGVDVYFDNVGGDMLQAVMERLALGARVVLCGLMAQYNEDGMPPGPNPAWTIKARATVRGMVVYDHEDLRAKMVEDVSGWLADGKVHYLEDRAEGLAEAPAAFTRLMRGQNVGKAVVVVGSE
ncbi:MAG: NADP-dependent oxidoreductase [Gammaproteobacteria bacterium]|nr:NADP-dependent oxidoreductase [Gammaproteobacteria bacterium]